MTMPDNSNFYCDMPGFTSFANHALDDSFYRPLPIDWTIVVTDIVSSTSAVERGRYQDVNYVGAACIAALRNALPDRSIPTAFSGDGANAAVSSSDLKSVLRTLNETRTWALQAFSLDLRIGAVPVSEIMARGGRVEVGKLDLGLGNELAMFRGSGFELADRLVKDCTVDNPFRIVTEIVDDASPDLSSLSCRWSPLTPTHDVMLCVLIEVREQVDGRKRKTSDDIYRDVLNRIDDIVDIDSPTVNPVKLSNLKLRFNYGNFMKEMKSTSGSCSKRLLTVIRAFLIAIYTLRFGFKVGFFDPDLCRRKIPLNSDYKRINGSLQLVLDCTREQTEAIESMLENQFKDRSINYGLFRSDSALITCITPDLANGIHVHYIDGSNGGFWHAANALKTRRIAN